MCDKRDRAIPCAFCVIFTEINVFWSFTKRSGDGRESLEERFSRQYFHACQTRFGVLQSKLHVLVSFTLSSP